MGVPSAGPFLWWLDVLVFCIDRWWALLATVGALAAAVDARAGWQGTA